jgi:GntR family transcriptional regulator/GntR family frlABCD operon transcriptional regulator
VKPNVRPWPENFMFNIPEEIRDLGCIHLERLRLVNDQAIFYDINYIPNINLPRFTSRKFENKSLFDILRVNYNIEIKGGEQKLRAIGASQPISRYFNVKRGHPVLHLERKLETNRPGFNIYSSFFCNTENYSLTGIF